MKLKLGVNNYPINNSSFVLMSRNTTHVGNEIQFKESTHTQHPFIAGHSSKAANIDLYLSFIQLTILQDHMVNSFCYMGSNVNQYPMILILKGLALNVSVIYLLLFDTWEFLFTRPVMSIVIMNHR